MCHFFLKLLFVVIFGGLCLSQQTTATHKEERCCELDRALSEAQSLYQQGQQQWQKCAQQLTDATSNGASVTTELAGLQGRYDSLLGSSQEQVTLDLRSLTLLPVRLR